MKCLDELLMQMQSPIPPLMEWEKGDQNEAIDCCILDLYNSKKKLLIDIFFEIYPEDQILEMHARIEACIFAIKNNGLVDYNALYMPFEYIINDRIDFVQTRIVYSQINPHGDCADDEFWGQSIK